METRFTITEGTSGIVTLLVQELPWDWGGPRPYDTIALPVTWPLYHFFLRKRIVFDRTFQKVVSERRFLFWPRRKEIPFSDIESVDASYRSKTVLQDVKYSSRYGGTYHL